MYPSDFESESNSKMSTLPTLCITENSIGYNKDTIKLSKN